MRELGRGSYESRRVDFTDSHRRQILRTADTKIAEMDLAGFPLELDEAAADLAKLVDGLFARKKPQE